MANLKNTNIDDTGFVQLPVGTTSQRPGTAETGMLRFNTELGALENYDGIEWTPVVSIPITADGGTVSDATIDGEDYRVHAFTSTGSSTFTVSSTGTTDGGVDVLVVGGGGAGSTDNGAGGGAGGLVFKENVQTTNQSYTITVGAGGNTVTGNSVGLSDNGDNSQAFGLTALGGGAGGGGNTSNPGRDGGSGGGEDGEQKDGRGSGIQPGTNSTADLDLGNNGGSASSIGDGPGGGGGGAGAAAPTSGGNKNQAGNGGDGYDMSAFFGTGFGENGYFAGGGAGGVGNSAGRPPSDWGNGGLGGGADHGKNGAAEYAGLPGQPNTGGGGAGGAYSGSTQIDPGAGGSGIVLIRYRI